MSSEFYKDFISGFDSYDDMKPAVYNLKRGEYWDVDALREIEAQVDLLSIFERFMLKILQHGIRVSNFYYMGGLSWYPTSIRSNFERKVFGGEAFEKYLLSKIQFNQQCGEAFISVITMYDEQLFLEHNEKITDDEINFLNNLSRYSITEKKEIDEILGSIFEDD